MIALYMMAFGMLTKGNIDVNARPIVHNIDGSISTVYTYTIEVDGRYILIPGIDTTKKLTDKQAIEQYRESGLYLGMFLTEQGANRYAIYLHNSQAKKYAN